MTNEPKNVPPSAEVRHEDNLREARQAATLRTEPIDQEKQSQKMRVWFTEMALRDVTPRAVLDHPDFLYRSQPGDGQDRFVFKETVVLGIRAAREYVAARPVEDGEST